MNQSEIIQELKTSHSIFIDYINSLSESEFENALPEKWTAGQQLVHMVKSVSPLVKAFKMPNLVLKSLFGTSKEGSRTFQEVVDKYLAVIEAGAKAPNDFVPPEHIPFNQKQKLTEKLEEKVNECCKLVEKYPEADLDKYRLPHPVLGKLTIREMLYFTIYHVQHHRRTVERDIA